MLVYTKLQGVTMRSFIITVFLLLGIAGVAFAAGQQEPSYPPYCWQQPAGQTLWFPCGSDDAKVTHCANLMETAMIKVDPYLKLIETGSSKLSPAKKEELKRALYTWNRIKHECWKEFEAERLEGQHLH